VERGQAEAREAVGQGKGKRERKRLDADERPRSSRLFIILLVQHPSSMMKR
jgi:hypothetical protein